MPTHPQRTTPLGISQSSGTTQYADHLLCRIIFKKRHLRLTQTLDLQNTTFFSGIVRQLFLARNHMAGTFFFGFSRVGIIFFIVFKPLPYQ